MRNSAIGMIEVEGHSVALAVVDKITKEAVVKILALDCNNPQNEQSAQIPMTVQVIFEGAISEVVYALEVGKEEARKYLTEDVIRGSYLSKEADGIRSLLTVGKVSPQQYKEMNEQPLSLAIFEVQHFTNALILSNDLLNHYDLIYSHHELNLGGRLVTLIFSGEESQIYEAITFVEMNKGKYANKVFTAIPINKPTSETIRYTVKNKGE